VGNINLSPQQKSLINSLRNSYRLNKANQVSECISELSEKMTVELKTLGYKFTERIPELALYLGKLKGSLAQRLALMNQQSNNQSANVTLMTMHSSKGLESKRVFVTNFSKRIIPTPNRNECMSETSHEEEERRLAFVAITRGEDSVYITSCENSAARRGYFGRSRFVDEMGDIKSYDHTKRPDHE